MVVSHGRKGYGHAWKKLLDEKTSAETEKKRMRTSEMKTKKLLWVAIGLRARWKLGWDPVKRSKARHRVVNLCTCSGPPDISLMVAGVSHHFGAAIPLSCIFPPHVVA